jgi:GNAT superfamily N-acetyltransferase
MDALSIRGMDPRDVETIAALNGELGYPSTVGQVDERLSALAHSASDALFVAEDGGRVVGWVHVALKLSLVEVPSAQVMGLVVGEGQRGGGIGRQLLRRAEAWAAERGVRRMLVASRTTRERAHRFYEREGYVVLKRSYFFEKQLAD